MQKATVYEFMFKKNAYIKHFTNPANETEDYENKKNSLKW